DRGMALLRVRILQRVRTPRRHHRRVLGGQDEVGAGSRRVADAGLGARDVVRQIVAAGDLDAADLEAPHGGLVVHCAALPNRRSSSLPACSNAWMPSQSPRYSPLTKICGTEVRPPARCVISARREGFI